MSEEGNNDGHMTGDNEEVSESRGTSGCDCRHEIRLIVQRRAMIVGAASMFAFTSTSSVLLQVSRTVLIDS